MRAATAPPTPFAIPYRSWSDAERVAREHFGVRAFRPGQRELLEAALAGKDAVGLRPTGAGKSLCFQLAAMFLPKAVVVVSPLLALMRDQDDKLGQQRRRGTWGGGVAPSSAEAEDMDHRLPG